MVKLTLYEPRLLQIYAWYWKSSKSDLFSVLVSCQHSRWSRKQGRWAGSSPWCIGVLPCFVFDLVPGILRHVQSREIKLFLNFDPYLAPIWSLLSLIEPYWTLLSLVEPCSALLNLIEPYWALLSLVEPYWALLRLIEPYWALTVKQ